MDENVSLWERDVTMPCFPRLEQDVKTDVLIIGGGMAGVLTAYLLRRSGVDCILVEQDRIGSGTTRHTTAKLTLQHGLCYHRLLKQRGLGVAQGYYLANRAALEELSAICRPIDCDYERQDNYVYSVDDPNKLQREMAALDAVGCEAQFHARLSVPLDMAGAVCVPHQAQCHPLKLLARVADGLPIYEHTKVREMIGNTAVTAGGRIFADTVVVATHFPFINKHGGYFVKMYQHRSYVAALAGAPTVEGMIVDDDDSGLSFRRHGEWLLVGGGGHRTGKRGGGWPTLDCAVRELYPRATMRYRWAAQDCMTLDGAPYIGQYSRGTAQMLVATGFNKWGMTGSMVSARLLSDRLLGMTNPCAEVFSPSRSMLHPQLAANLLESTLNLLTPTSPRCPHLGCALKWNAAEHSWDCPCHGSRFDEHGTLLDGPATDDVGI